MKGSSITVAAAVFACCALPAIAQFPGVAEQKYRHYSNSLAPYVVSPQTIVERMLEMADLKPGETLYDLGSGDGRILITAVQHFRAKAVGVEISDSLVQATNERIKKLGLQNDARVIHGDLLETDLSPADVVTIYLMTDSNEILRPNLEKYLKTGARVVSHEYAVPGWKPKRVEKSEPGDHVHLIYLYEMPPVKK
jgi:ubiquinone/menaquinone biosynthesis C-methylase UbiE